jgi:tRNA nucleotidyltransferase/poly(A) polymerase
LELATKLEVASVLDEPQVGGRMATFDPQKQRDFAVQVVEQLRAAGFTAYWAGGCVRDHLLKRQPKDYDVATSATPPEIRQVFGSRKTLEIGAAFGVVAVVGPYRTGTVEVTTFRRDATYSDGRHPDAIAFSTPEEDAQRRDFTINGLFFDPLDQRVIDFVHGVEDLERGVVRAIGDPRARFSEDKLRLLRAVRMATTFGFRLDEATATAIREMAPQVTVVSAERIAQEMRLLLVLPRRVSGLTILRDTGLLDVLLPELADAVASGRQIDGREAWTTTLAVLGELAEPTFPLSLAAVLHTIERPEVCVRNLAGRWKLSNYESDRAAWLVQHVGELANASGKPWSQVQRLLAAPGGPDLVALAEARVKAAGASLESTNYCRTRLALPRDELDPPPLVTGDDLLAHGVRRGKKYAVLLTHLRDAQLDGLIADKQAGLRLVDEWLAAGKDSPTNTHSPSDD